MQGNDRDIERHRRTSDHASSDLIIPYQQDDMKMDKLEPLQSYFQSKS